MPNFGDGNSQEAGVPSAGMGRVRVAVAGGVAVAVAAVGGVAVARTMHTRITDCGFDAHGSYAKVHVPVGHKDVWVDFYVDDQGYAVRGAYDVHGTTVVWAPFPLARLHISGRTVYTDASHGNGPLHFVTKQYAEAHPGKTRTETVPDKSHTISCGIDTVRH